MEQCLVCMTATDASATVCAKPHACAKSLRKSEESLEQRGLAGPQWMVEFLHTCAMSASTPLPSTWQSGLVSGGYICGLYLCSVSLMNCDMNL